MNLKGQKKSESQNSCQISLHIPCNAHVQGKNLTPSSIAQMFVNKHSFADKVGKTFQQPEITVLAYVHRNEKEGKEKMEAACGG